MPVVSYTFEGMVPGNSARRAGRGRRRRRPGSTVSAAREGESEKTQVVESLSLGEIDERVSARAVSDHEERDPPAVAELLGGLDDDFEALWNSPCSPK